MRQISVSNFLEFLAPLRADDFKADKIDLFFKDNQFAEDTFLPFIHFRDDTYGRNLVFRNKFFELAVLTWLPGHRTPIHDHANQRCWMLIESGELTFKNYESLGLTGGKLKAQGRAETRKTGSQLYIDDDLGLHAITNNSNKPAVSVHLYAGPIEKCLIYNESTKQFENKNLSYLTEGIWAPNGELVESRICQPSSL